MKRITPEQIRAWMDAAPAMVVPFNGGRVRFIDPSEVATVQSGIITISPLAVLIQQFGFWWEFEAEQLRQLRQIAREYREARLPSSSSPQPNHPARSIQ